MMRLSSKNDDSSLCYDVIITHQNFYIDKFCDFRVISILKLRWTYFFLLILFGLLKWPCGSIGFIVALIVAHDKILCHATQFISTRHNLLW